MPQRQDPTRHGNRHDASASQEEDTMTHGQEEGNQFPRLAIGTTKGGEENHEDKAWHQTIRKLGRHFRAYPQDLEDFLREIANADGDDNRISVSGEFAGHDKDSGVANGKADRCKQMARVVARTAVTIAASHSGSWTLRLVLRGVAMLL